MTELCKSCKLYDKTFQKCSALRDTDFNKPCPFYREFHEQKPFPRTKCLSCFGYIGGKCVPLEKIPRRGDCRFFKTQDEYDKGLEAAREKFKELMARDPKRFRKYEGV